MHIWWGPRENCISKKFSQVPLHCPHISTYLSLKMATFHEQAIYQLLTFYRNSTPIDFLKRIKVGHLVLELSRKWYRNIQAYYGLHARSTLKNRQNCEKIKEPFFQLAFYHLRKIFNLPSEKYYHLIMRKMQIEVKTARIPKDDPHN